MTQIKSIEKLPYIDVQVRLYNIAYPIEENGDTKTFYMQFQMTETKVTVGEGLDEVEVGRITSPTTGGAFLFYDGMPSLEVEGHHPIFFLPPDDLWLAVSEKIGFDQDKAANFLLEKKKADPVYISMKAIRSKPIQQKIPEPEPAPEPKQEQKLEPDYHSSHTMTGGHIKDIPEPHIRYYPNSFSKRTLTIRIMRHPGYPHFFVNLIEENNPIWNSKDGIWQVAWDDKEGHGNSFSPADDVNQKKYEFDRLVEATDWIEKTLKERYPPSIWQYEKDDLAGTEAEWTIKYSE